MSKKNCNFAPSLGALGSTEFKVVEFDHFGKH